MTSASTALRASTVAHDHHHDHIHHHHGHGDHAHAHHHGLHGHHHHEAGERSHARPDNPRFSLMRLSAAQRLGGAAAIIAILWSCVWWALQ